MDVQPVLALITAARLAADPVFVGIGGHGGAGKSTLSRAIPDAQVVSTDAFWEGTDFDVARLRAQVLDPLLAGRVAVFDIWDWPAQAPGGQRRVAPGGIVVVEGVCALHRILRDAYHVRVWVEAPATLRLERGVERDGEEERSTWAEVWMPREERYVERDRPVECAHLIVEGTGAPPAAW